MATLIDQNNPRIHFTFIPWSRIITSILLLLTAWLDFKILGYYIGNPGTPIIGEYNGMGTALVLGGVSFFYLTGLPLGLIGIGLFLYSIVSIHKMEIEIKGDDISITDSYFIFGFRALKSRFKENISNVNLFRLQNQKKPLNYAWFVIFLPMIVGLIQYGLPLYVNNNAPTKTLPIILIFNACILIMALFLLIFYTTSTMHIEFSDKYIEASFPPFIGPVSQSHNESSQKTSFFDDLFAFLKNNFSYNENKWELINNIIEKEPKFKSKFFLKQLIIGIYFITIALISAFFQVFFGFLFWIVAIIYGCITFSNGYSNSNEISLVRKEFHSKFFKSPLTNSLFEKITLLLIIGIGMIQIGMNFNFLDINDFASLFELVGSIIILSIGLLLFRSKKNKDD